MLSVRLHGTYITAQYREGLKRGAENCKGKTKSKSFSHAQYCSIKVFVVSFDTFAKSLKRPTVTWMEWNATKITLITITDKNNSTLSSCLLCELPPCWVSNFPATRTLRSEEVWTTFTLIGQQNHPLLLGGLVWHPWWFVCYNHTHYEPLP